MYDCSYNIMPHSGIMPPIVNELSQRINEIIAECVSGNLFCTVELVVSVLLDRYNVPSIQSFGISDVNHIPLIYQLNRFHYRVNSFIAAFLCSSFRSIKCVSDLERELVRMLQLIGLAPFLSDCSKGKSSRSIDANEIPIDSDDDNAPIPVTTAGVRCYRDYGLGDLELHPLVRQAYPTLLVRSLNRAADLAVVRPTAIEIHQLLISFIETERHQNYPNINTNSSYSSCTSAMFVEYACSQYRVPNLSSIGVVIADSIANELFMLNQIINNRMLYQQQLKEAEAKAFEKRRIALENYHLLQIVQQPNLSQQQHVNAERQCEQGSEGKEELSIAELSETVAEVVQPELIDYSTAKLALRPPTENPKVSSLLDAFIAELHSRFDMVHSPSYKRVAEAVASVCSSVDRDSDSNKKKRKKNSTLNQEAFEETVLSNERDAAEDNRKTTEQRPQGFTSPELRGSILALLTDYVYLHVCSWKHLKKRLDVVLPEASLESLTSSVLMNEVNSDHSALNVERLIHNQSAQASPHTMRLVVDCKKKTWASVLDTVDATANIISSTIRTSFLSNWCQQQQQRQQQLDGREPWAVCISSDQDPDLATIMPEVSVQPSALSSTDGAAQEAGRWGEAFVYALLQTSHPKATIQWVNQHSESRAPYDFIVTLPSNTASAPATASRSIVIYVEVKSTRYQDNNVFDISLPEWEFANRLPRVQYAIARVFGARSGPQQHDGSAGGFAPTRVVIIPDLVRSIEAQRVKLCVAI